MAIFLAQSKTATGSGTSATVTFDAPVTAGNHIILIAAARGSSGFSSTVNPDNQGNAYNRDFAGSVSTGISSSPDNKLLEAFSSHVVTGGTITITYSVSASATDISLNAQEWSGLFQGAQIDGSPGAGWIDHAVGVGAGTPPPYTLSFATDFPDRAAYYGTTLPLISISAGYNSALSTFHESFPNADHSVTASWAPVPFGVTSVAFIVLYVGPTSPPTLSCGNPPPGMVGFPYTHQFPYAGGVAPYTWVVTAGTFPPGLTLNGANGHVSGVPTTAGTYSFTLQVTDAHGVALSLACSITINPAVTGGSVLLDLWVWRELFRFDSVTQELSFPPGYEKALLFTLMAEFYLQYPPAQAKFDYDELLADAEAATRDLEIINESDKAAMEPPI